jgi:hypothetical protein
MVESGRAGRAVALASFLLEMAGKTRDARARAAGATAAVLLAGGAVVVAFLAAYLPWPVLERVLTAFFALVESAAIRVLAGVARKAAVRACCVLETAAWARYTCTRLG